jgi:chemotaxis protein MotB
MQWLPAGLPEHNEGGAERYLITYADMITLLLVLFIILYATANQDLEKFQALSQSLAEGFGATAPAKASAQGGTPIADTSGGGDKPVDMFPENQTPIQVFEFQQSLSSEGGKEGPLLKEIEDLIEQAAQQSGVALEGINAEVQVDVTERGIRISIFPDQILFESGSAVLKPAFKSILGKLAAPIKGLPNQVEVQGHTDNVPISTGTYPSNWELSAGRAGAVIRYFESVGVPSARLQAAGYADTRPLDSNATKEGRARNRRVEIIILRGAQGETAPSQPAPTESAAASLPSEASQAGPEGAHTAADHVAEGAGHE